MMSLDTLRQKTHKTQILDFSLKQSLKRKVVKPCLECLASLVCLIKAAAMIAHSHTQQASRPIMSMRSSFLFTLGIAKLSGNMRPAQLAGNSKRKAHVSAWARGTGEQIKKGGELGSMNTLPDNQRVVYQSSQIRRILRLLGWRDFRLDHPEQKRIRRAGPRVNGVPLPIARELINRDASDHGIEIDQGQLGRVVRLLCAGFFADHQEGE